MLQDSLKLSGRVGIVLHDKDGNVIHEQTTENLVVNDGLNFICSRMEGTSQDVMSHMAVGTNSTAVAAGDTTLGTELARVALASTTVSTNTIEYVASYSAGTGTGALVEAGIFNASSAGDMLCHVVFDVINKAAADSMTITWTITLTAS
jgi:tRNA G37 N-methylase TrmD